jgi:alanyl-tRNA synthetase
VLVGQLSGLLGARPDELAERVSALLGRLKDTERELASLQQAKLLALAPDIAASAVTLGPTLIVTHRVTGPTSADDLRALVLDVRARLGEAEPTVVAIGGEVNDRAAVVVATNAAARGAGRSAGALVKLASGVLGGGGGGRDDVAQGGGSRVAALDEALVAVTAAVAS